LLQFQSPSLRGTSATGVIAHSLPALPVCFNPLRFGAPPPPKTSPRSGRGGSRVSIPFASGHLRHGLIPISKPDTSGMFQSPSLRGTSAT